MSITRRGCDGSDVYLYESSGNYVCCSGCCQNDDDDLEITTDLQALNHIKLHMEDGDKVPQHTIDYFNDRMNPNDRLHIISNVTQEDIDKVHQSPKIPKYELYFKALDKNGKLIREFALGAFLQEGSGADKVKKIHALFFSMKRTVEKTLENGDI